LEYNLKDETIKYCINDVMLTQKMLINLFSVVDKKFLKYIRNSFSASSLSNAIFYNYYNYKDIFKSIPKHQDTYIRNAFYGGRTEVFGNLNATEHIKYFDFSGMYGQSMKEEFHYGEGFYSISSSYDKIGFHTIKYKSDKM
jgi:hypothetical protein